MWVPVQMCRWRLYAILMSGPCAHCSRFACAGILGTGTGVLWPLWPATCLDQSAYCSHTSHAGGVGAIPIPVSTFDMLRGFFALDLCRSCGETVRGDASRATRQFTLVPLLLCEAWVQDSRIVQAEGALRGARE